jgi:DNA invertase Pin-like site-specific DNA recombinase
MCGRSPSFFSTVLTVDPGIVVFCTFARGTPDLNNRQIGFKSITENIDTMTSGGKLVFHIFGALAEFERDIIRERTQAGLQAARARGRKGGRPKALPPKKVAMLGELYENKNLSINEMCETLNKAPYGRTLRTSALSSGTGSLRA